MGVLVFTAFLSGQSLFEKVEAEQKDRGMSYEMNGYLRSVLFVGKVPEKNAGETKSVYGEASLKLRLRKKNFGDAFAEVRFRRGFEFHESLAEFNLREAYVNAYLGPFDFRVGHQIVVWGRADGINPTDNITPKNMLARSPDEDDRREGNFLIRSYCTLQPIRLEAIWIPAYRSSVVPIDLLTLPPGIHVAEPDYPDPSLGNSAFALRLNLELASFDGSISYFNGHDPFPGLAAEFPQTLGNDLSLDVFLKSYRMHTLGADFQTTVAGSFGLRGEMAYRKPCGHYERNAHIPNPDLTFVLGVDKEFSGNFSLILQYLGKYVFDFEELMRPKNLVELPIYELEQKNRLIFSQQYRLSHSFFGRAEKALFYETLKIELLSMLNITTEEFLLRPKITYDITDELTLIFGGELFSGPEDTLFGSIDSALNSVFLELRAFF
ncbi:MAG: hypothetical protein ACE5L7_01770 [Candidatus Aminicenantales bacterium]